MKVKVHTLKTIISIFLIAILVYIAYLIFIKSFIHYDRYTFFDYLINYQDGGFKRRGLSGTLGILLYDNIGLSLNTYCFLIALFPYIILIFYLIKLVYEKRVSTYSISLLLSPIGISYYLSNYPVVGRKEAYLILLFVLYGYYYNKIKNNRALQMSIMIALCVLTLQHEMTLFFISYFIVFNVYSNKKINIKDILELSLLPLILTVIIYHYGLTIDNGKTESILALRNIIIPKEGMNIFSWNINEFQYIIDYLWDYVLYIIPYLFVIYISYKVSKNEFKNITNRQYALIQLILLTSSAPLFLMSIDWGRWVHIHCMMQLIFILNIHNNENRELIEIDKGKQIAIAILIFSLLFIKVKHLQRAISYKTIFVELFMKSINKNYPHNSDTLGE